MELKEIKNLIELLKNTDITELQVEREGSKLKIKREKYFPAFESMPGPAIKPISTQIETQEKTAEEKNFVTISSPIVGMYYSAASPEAPPLVEAGSKVKKGQVLCIIEAMKLMNEIESDTDGTIVKILVENGQPVEYGEPLFFIDPLS